MSLPTTFLAAAPQTVTTLSTTGGITAGTVAALVLGGGVWYVAKHKGTKWGHLVMAVALGIVLANSVIGGAISQGIAAGTNALTGIVGSLSS